jgi:hypothetical protein
MPNSLANQSCSITTELSIRGTRETYFRPVKTKQYLLLMSEQEFWYMMTTAGSIVTVGIIGFFIYSLWRSWKER